MDDAKTRQTIQDHADAVVRGDMDHVAGDLIEELRPALAQLAPLFPQPVESATVDEVTAGDDRYVARIRYSGPDKELTIRSQWQDRDGTPMIVAAEPV